MRHLLVGLLCLANVATAQCPGDCNADSEVTIDELVAAVDAALTGCPAEGATAGMVRTCGPGGIITEPEVFIPSPSEATPVGGVLQINDAIYQASGFGNTFLVVTNEGNVVIETSIILSANAHKTALQAINAGPVRRDTRRLEYAAASKGWQPCSVWSQSLH